MATAKTKTTGWPKSFVKDQPNNTLEQYDRPGVTLYPLSNYTFGVKEAVKDKDASVSARFFRMKEEYANLGMRKTTEGVLIVHEHNLPHVLLLQLGTSFYKLPGGELEHDEESAFGLTRLLNELLATKVEDPINFQIKRTISTWWRPNFSPPQVKYINYKK